MIVVDSSVVVAILQREPDAATWIEVFDKTSKALMSVVSFVETSMVICGRRPDPDPDEITSLLDALGIDVVSVTPKQARRRLRHFCPMARARTALALIWLIVSPMLSRRCSEHPFFIRE